MSSKLDDVTGASGRFFDLRLFFSEVELTLRGFLVPDFIELLLIEVESEKQIDIERLEFLDIELTRVLIQTEVQLLLFLGIGDRDEDYGDFGHTEIFCDIQAEVTADDDVLAPRRIVADDRVDESESLNARLELSRLLLGVFARVVLGGD